MNRPARARRHFTITVGNIEDMGAALVAATARCVDEDAAVYEEKVLGEVAHRIEAELVAMTDKLDKVVDGQFKAAWATERAEGGWDNPNDAPYSGVIELGRRANRPGPPYAPILEWVEKLIAAGRMSLEEGDTPERVAFAIREHIHVFGTKPTFILRGLLVDPKIGRWLRSAARRHRLSE